MQSRISPEGEAVGSAQLSPVTSGLVRTDRFRESAIPSGLSAHVAAGGSPRAAEESPTLRVR